MKLKANEQIWTIDIEHAEPELSAVILRGGYKPPKTFDHYLMLLEYRVNHMKQIDHKENLQNAQNLVIDEARHEWIVWGPTVEDDDFVIEFLKQMPMIGTEDWLKHLQNMKPLKGQLVSDQQLIKDLKNFSFFDWIYMQW